VGDTVAELIEVVVSITFDVTLAEPVRVAIRL
jgi:hypothetical protein